ncbi:MAG: transporter, family, cyanate transporter [Gaiellales bacterium]|jgi:CP family cyanate transporter-like MFS transporter|nr:transporter, family, cyanate transporter [Gaiellales bacterium]
MATTTNRPFLVLAGIVLAALALRPQIIAIGPLVDAIDSDLGVSHTVTGLLGTIPLLCMGVFAPTAGPIAARIGATRAMTLVLLTIGVAGIARAVAPGALGVIVLTVPIGIGIAIGNVLAPVIVKTAFADRPLLATGLFAFGIQIGAGAGGALAVPLADSLGGWRDSLLAISVVCAVVAVAWIPVARAVHMPAATTRAPALPWHSPAAWRLAIMFSFVSTTYYGTGAWLADAFVEHGWSEARAGSLIGILNVAALGGTLLIAFAGDRIGSRRTYLVGGLGLVFLGLLLAILAPAAGIAAAVLMGLGIGCGFSLSMALPLDVAADGASVAATTGLMLLVAYVIAAASPVGLGAIRDLTGGYAAVLWVLAGTAAGAVALGATLSPDWLHRARTGAAEPVVVAL